MATPRGQRIGIWIISIALIVGTLGSFAVMILSTSNSAKDQARLKQLKDEYSKEYVAYQAKVTAQADELSTKYYPTFSPYASQVSAFDLDSNNKALQTQDLTVGDGEEITGTTKFAAYYIGWNPKGKIFDQSIKDGKLIAPIAIANGLDSASLITGWKEGMKGMKLGGVRLLTIPSDKAYGEAEKSADIPANTPLRFVVMAVPAPETIAQPAMSAELLKLYGVAQ